MRRVRKLARLLTRPVWRLGLRLGVAAAVEHDAAIRRVAPAAVLDLGAHRGQFVLAVKGVRPGAAIEAVEPQADAAAVARTVADAVGGVRVHRAAVRPERGRAGLTRAARSDSSSLLPIGARQAAVFPGTHAAGRETVPAAPLADLVDAATLPRPLLLKLDVQGAELDVLRAAGPALARADGVLCECSDVTLYPGQALRPQILTVLARWGFAPVWTMNAVHAPGLGRVQADVLCVRDVTSASAAGSAASAQRS